MDRQPRSSAAAVALTTPDAARTAPVAARRGPSASCDRACDGGAAGDSAEITRRLIEDHDRIAQGLNTVVVRRLFAAGLDLQAALGLLGDHRAAAKICHAISELDQAVVDLRNTVFGRSPADSRSSR